MKPVGKIVNPKTKPLKFAFFPGCMIQVRYPQMEAAVRKTVPTTSARPSLAAGS